MPRILAPTRPDPNDPAIAEAARVLRSGGLVAFPTETVYGLGANALDATAAGRVFAVKGRPANNPLIVHVPGAAEARLLAARWAEAAETLARLFWPGPLTLVLPKGPSIQAIVTAEGPTVALRSPAHPVARAMLEASELPVAAPSANRSGHISPTTARHVARGLGERVDLILDGGPCPGGIESTVVDLSREQPVILRAGPVTAEQIAAALGVDVCAPNPVFGAEGPLASPGMLARHYAPAVPLVLVEPNCSIRASLADGDGILLFRKDHTTGLEAAARVVEMPEEPDRYAARLYAALHELEEVGVRRIVAEIPPELPEWRAVRDRLFRASTSS